MFTLKIMTAEYIDEWILAELQLGKGAKLAYVSSESQQNGVESSVLRVVITHTHGGGSGRVHKHTSSGNNEGQKCPQLV